jgi:RHH-type proline utilization regulon transcriptional repressor/proline dehydrogenase/delta 1-pyrroline-5-carboxylate dehydrogenase
MLATGNRGVLEGMRVPPSLPRAIAERLSETAEGPIAAALVEGDAEVIRAASAEMAAREGMIVPVHVAGADGCYPQDWLLEERSTSINTTAAGGNASLMMIG